MGGPKPKMKLAAQEQPNVAKAKSKRSVQNLLATEPDYRGNSFDESRSHKSAWDDKAALPLACFELPSGRRRERSQTDTNSVPARKYFEENIPEQWLEKRKPLPKTGQ